MHIAPFFYLGQADREEESGAKTRASGNWGHAKSSLHPCIHGSEGGGKGDVESE